MILASAAAHSLSASRRLAMTTPMVSEVMLQCSDGIRLAAQHWKNSDEAADHKILCLHGWMDNCRSFYQLAPRLLERLNVELVAVDLPGHGQSDHRSQDGPPILLAESAFYVNEALQQLQWSQQNVTVIGHSMGAGIGCLYAAAFPEHVSRLVLLEGAGPLARPASDIAKHVRAHVQRRQLGLQTARPPRVYESLASAVETRRRTAENFPGQQYLSAAAAEQMVRRGTRDVEGGVAFRHDPRLQWPSVQYFTPEQAMALYNDIQCPTALLLAEDGWPFEADKLQAGLDLLRPSLYQRLPGSHHFHADPDSAEAVAAHVIEFLEKH